MPHSASVMPIPLCDRPHVPARIMSRSLEEKAVQRKSIYQLIPAAGAVVADAFPIHPEGGVVAQSRHQVVDEGSEHVVAAEAPIQGLLRMSGCLRIEHDLPLPYKRLTDKLSVIGPSSVLIRLSEGAACFEPNIIVRTQI